MKMSEAGHTSNIEYWKAVAKRYQSQRDMALQKVQFLQERMLEETGKAYDGNDWLRQVAATGARRNNPHPQFFAQIKENVLCIRVPYGKDLQMTITGHSFSQLIDQGKVDDHLTDKLVNRPDHYTGGNVECIEAIKAATQGLPAFEAICVGHIIRYLWRYRVKHPQNPLVDVKKSVYYLNRLIAEIESQERK
jgi:hypothetical protein